MNAQMQIRLLEYEASLAEAAVHWNSSQQSGEELLLHSKSGEA